MLLSLVVSSVLADSLTVPCQSVLSSQKANIVTNCGQYLDLNSLSENTIGTIASQTAPQLTSICTPQCLQAVKDLSTNFGNCTSQVADVSTGLTISQLVGIANIAQAGLCAKDPNTNNYCIQSQVSTLAPIIAGKNASDALAAVLGNKQALCNNCTSAEISAVIAIPLSSLDTSLVTPIRNGFDQISSLCQFTIGAAQATAKSGAAAYEIASGLALSFFLLI
ncbi:hypothetical protein HK103_001991 [Boothiomyces macroporosus]|uniref:Uncharacterized protein n=1 Tax=Boothiomyces macroporosus TaxID=261099 RepID=A0AAD5Y0K9_9FUNG|nr:hypothetical protein HK103_002931 [Boothiomyces macroporosus]KAJ3251926.1 hypothetical protein HK103_001991 [Boothiomyces macroporosus]